MNSSQLVSGNPSPSERAAENDLARFAYLVVLIRLLNPSNRQSHPSPQAAIRIYGWNLSSADSFVHSLVPLCAVSHSAPKGCYHYTIGLKLEDCQIGEVGNGRDVAYVVKIKIVIKIRVELAWISATFQPAEVGDAQVVPEKNE